ncbi:DegT/DnrJ/EryC1/StrS family aminotransferase [Candidatus Dependentiae bacterium]|nr:DegT/DnrJ/EryC1/StrS family aminotransferase [Candidatus Dependentiae bacterium]
MNHHIPFFSLERQLSNIKNSLELQINQLLSSNQFVGGPYVDTFEKKFATYTETTHAISCNSGTDALWLSLAALEITPNSIVLTTPFSFIASSSEIAAHKAHPVFIDIDESYNICPKKIETWLKIHAIVRHDRAVHKKTGFPIAGIISVDLFGQCANYNAIKSIANDWNLWIIEDACQAVGAHIDNKKAGTFGDISCFSLYPTKNLGVCGDGGVMTTNSTQLAEKLFKLRNHGRATHYNYECQGRNSRLDAIQALIATEKLKYLDDYNDRRREIAQYYTKRLSKIPFIKTPRETVGHHVYHQYSIQVTNRKTIQEQLLEKKIETNIFYPKTLDQIPFLTPPKELATDCPIAHNTTQNILALPIWPELTDNEIKYVCSCLENSYVVNRNPRPLDTPAIAYTRGKRGCSESGLS